MNLEKTSIKDAFESKDFDMYEKAITEIADERAEKALANAIKDHDASIMKARGKRDLTSSEMSFYNGVIDALKAGARGSAAFKDAITGINVVMPETVIDTVFDDLTTSHPLISKLDVIRTNAKIKVHFANMGTTKAATWGPIDGKITTEIGGAFTEVDAGAQKLSCFMPVPNSMIDLGPAYLDRFVRTLLYEAMANGIENAVVNNKVSNTGPLGMGVDFAKAGTVTNGVTTYTDKSAVAVTEWTPKGLSAAIKALSTTKNGLPRKAGNLFMVVNPTDNIEKIKPAVCVQNGMGEWVDRSPYAIEIVESTYVPSGTAYLGINKQYALALCSSTIDGNLEYSDEYQFLEEVRTFKIKLYGDGRPKDNNSFVKLNIASLKEAQLLVTNVTTAAAGA